MDRSRASGFHMAPLVLRAQPGHPNRSACRFILGFGLGVMLESRWFWPEAAWRTLFSVEYLETFFDAIRVSTRYLIFDSRFHLMNFLTKGLELESELEPRLPMDTS